MRAVQAALSRKSNPKGLKRRLCRTASTARAEFLCGHPAAIARPQAGTSAKSFTTSAPASQPHAQALKEGCLVEGWLVRSVERCALYNVTALVLVHPSTGATLVHMQCEDAHKYFSVNFRTPVDNDMGLPHILEHTTLCGSEKYDVKDPFHLMSKRSLNTDMNATTSATLTSYHFSTMNDADFNNLLGVYLDATFFPKLRRYDFEQEGHRIEPSDPSSPSSKLALKGVVYNEMKGYLSGSGEHITRALMTQLFPNTVYAYSHGGDPRYIPDLTHEQLVAFHRGHYSPENCLFTTYGNMNMADMLRRINSDCLRRVSSRISPTLPAATLLAGGAAAGRRLTITKATAPLPGDAIRRVRVPPDGYALLDGVVEEDEQPSKAGSSISPAAAAAAAEARANIKALAEENPDAAQVVQGAASNPNCTYMRAWAVGDSRSLQETLLLRVLLDLFTYGTDSPMYHFLVKPNLCTSTAGNTGVDTGTLQPMLMLGCSGLREEDLTSVSSAIDESIAFALDYWGYLEKVSGSVTAKATAEGKSTGEATKAALLAVAALPEDPFSVLRIRAVMHSIELSLRLRGPSFGATLASRIADYWSLGVDAPAAAAPSTATSAAVSTEPSFSLLEPLHVEDQVAQLKLTLGILEDGDLETVDGRLWSEVLKDETANTRSAETKAAQVLRQLLRSVTLQNSHGVQLLAVPDESLLDEWDAAESLRLQTAEQAWTAQQRSDALASSAAAEERRRRAPAEAAAVLPGLKLDAVSRVSPHNETLSHYLLPALPVPTQREALERLPLSTAPLPIPVQVVSEPTNGLAHLRILIGMQLPDMVASAGSSLLDQEGKPLRGARHPWYDLQASNPLHSSFLHVPDELHKFLPLACGFTGYGTRSMSSKQWEIATRTSMGRLGATITTATPTVLHQGAGRALQTPPSVLASLNLPSDATVTPPLYAIAIDMSWLCDDPRTGAAAHLMGTLFSEGAVVQGLLKERDRQLFSTAIRSAAVETALAVGENGEVYGGRWAAAGLHPLVAMAEVHGGLSQARFLSALAAAGEQGVEAAADACRSLVRSVVQRPLIDKGALRTIVESLAQAQGIAGGASMEPMLSPAGILHMEANGLNATTASLFPIRAMLTVEPSASHAVSVGMGMRGGGSSALYGSTTKSATPVALRKHETQDLGMLLTDHLLCNFELAAPTPSKPMRLPGDGDGRGLTVSQVVRGGPATPASLHTVNTLTPPLPRPVPPSQVQGMKHEPQRTLMHIPGSQVSGVVLVLRGPSWGTADHVAVHLAVSILGSGRLYEEVREVGGAYDVSARVGAADEIFIVTGEDPTPLDTLQRVREGIDWLCSPREGQAAVFTEQDLEEAKLSMFAETDAPVAPESRGLSSFVYGVSPSARRQYREWIFSCTREDVVAAARKWLQAPLEQGRYAVTIAGDSPKLKKQLKKADAVQPSQPDAAPATAPAGAKEGPKLLKHKPAVKKGKTKAASLPPPAHVPQQHLPPVSPAEGDRLATGWVQMEVLAKGGSKRK